MLAERSLGRSLGRALVVVIPLAIWYGYVRFVAGPSPHGLDNLGWPGVAFLQKWWQVVTHLENETYPLVPWFTLASLLGITVQAIWTLLHPDWKNPWWRVAAGEVVLMICMGPPPWGGYPDAAARVLLPLHLAFNVLVPRTRIGLAVLVLGNLGLISGLDQMSSRPQLADELAAARIEGASYLARTGAGWYDIEHRGSRTWCWSQGRATLHLFGWHEPSGGHVRVQFALNGFTPCRVTVQRGEKNLWTGTVGAKPVTVQLELENLENGGIDLRFETDSPGRRENETTGARLLTYSISGFRFVRDTTPRTRPAP